MLEMFKKFKNEEKGKASLEHIILAIGIILALILIFSIYSSAQEAINSCGDHPGCP